MKKPAELQAELDSFRGLWSGGYFEGDPLDPVFPLWGVTSFIGVSHAVYLACIKPHVNEGTTVLEIGCGRGAWTRTMLAAKKLYCLDALPPEGNCFFDYVGRHAHVHYVTVSDFSLKEIPLDSIDFTFSYDALCHVSFDGICEYAKNLFPRMRAGAHGFWMVADYYKYNEFIAGQDRLNALNSLLPRRKHRLIGTGLRWLFRRINHWNAGRYHLHALDANEDGRPRPGRWYHSGTRPTCEMLERNGFHVAEPDMGFDYRSPLIHFRK